MCTNPKVIWLRNQQPINFQEYPEYIQKRWTKARMICPGNDYRPIEVPCGKCRECRMAHAKEFALRCALEAKSWGKNSWFLTLTYSDEKRSKNKELVKKDFQDFMKRLRWHKKGAKAWINPNNGKMEHPIRYFACGEYGEKNKREHFHAIIFNLEIDDLKCYRLNKTKKEMLYNSAELEKIWGKGFVVIGRCSFQSCSYVARYVQKKAGISEKMYTYRWDEKQKKKIRKLKKGCKPEFVMMSTGVILGGAWWQENKHWVKCVGSIPLKINEKVQNFTLPRAFKKKWNEEDWESYEKFKYKKSKEAEDHFNEKIKEFDCAFPEKIKVKSTYVNIETGDYEYIEMETEPKIFDFKEYKTKKILSKRDEILREKIRLLKRNNFV